MIFDVTSLPGVLLVSNVVHGDDRGCFLEWFREDRFKEATGHAFSVRQANCSVSACGTLRGIHFADVPPGQAKLVICANGSILDVAVDLRVGSPTFGQSVSAELSSENRKAIYLPVGVGHAFQALADGSTVVYLCSEPYSPNREHEVHPLDPELAVRWPDGVPRLLSPKDDAAPTMRQAAEQALLPTWEECERHVRALRSQSERR